MSGASQTESSFAIWEASDSRISACDRRLLGVTTVTAGDAPCARSANRSLFFRTGHSAPASMGAYFNASSARQKLLLVLDLRPFVRVGGSGLALDDRLPGLRELGVERNPAALLRRHVVLGEDRLDRALGDAQRAIDAFPGIDHQHVRALAEAFDRAEVDAIGVLALDAALGDDVGHEDNLITPGMRSSRLSLAKITPYVEGPAWPPFRRGANSASIFLEFRACAQT